MDERIVEEGVIVALDEDLDPQFMVRRSPQNGGKVEFYKLDRMGFSDVKQMLEALTKLEPKV